MRPTHSPDCRAISIDHASEQEQSKENSQSSSKNSPIQRNISRSPVASDTLDDVFELFCNEPALLEDMAVEAVPKEISLYSKVKAGISRPKYGSRYTRESRKDPQNWL